jgi:hypothetical protein
MLALYDFHLLGSQDPALVLDVLESPVSASQP